MSNDLGMDRSGNGNNWTVNNITYADQMLDSPTNNFPTGSLIASTATAGTHTNVVYSEGNLKLRSTNSAVNGWKIPFRMTGKCYFEVCMLNLGWPVIGFGNWDWAGGSGIPDGIAALNLYPNNGSEYISHNAGSSTTDIGPNAFSIADGGIIGFAYDEATGKAWASINGTWYGSGNPATGANPIVTFNADKRNDIYPAGSVYDSGDYIALNFGQDSSFAGTKTAQGNQDGNDIGDFYYAPPTGFLALCTSNLPDVAVVPSEHFNTVLYTGNATARSITGVGFQSDLVWAKSRSVVDPHVLTDSVRGVQKTLMSNDNAVEYADSTGLTAFGSDGFTIGTASRWNGNTRTYVAWNWKANGSGSSNTNGSINSTVSANTDAGFSIVSWTGTTATTATIGHGLSKAPEMFIFKPKNASDNWMTYQKTLGNGVNSAIYLNLTNASSTDGGTGNYWNNTAPSSTLISFGDWHNTDAQNYIGYAFHSVDGYSKVGSYLGNISSGTADGTYVYTGFRPAWVMIKDTEQAVDWAIYDSTRLGFNQSNYKLEPSNTSAEQATTTHIQLNSNGFNFMTDNSNYSGRKYIYLAFAETPFKYSNAR